jgi:hypothetical protein
MHDVTGPIQVGVPDQIKVPGVVPSHRGTITVVDFPKF